MDAFLKTPKKSEEATATGSSPEINFQTIQLKSEDPNIQAFYNQLSENEQIAHKIAVIKLGTSYDVSRTHGYQKWSKTRSI